MNPQSHFLVPFLIAEILVKLHFLSPDFAILAGICGLLVDLDRFIVYVIYHRHDSIKKAWNISVLRHQIRKRSFMHHWAVFVLISLVILLLYFVNKQIFLVVAIGYYSHVLLDFIDFEVISKNALHIKEKGFAIRVSLLELVFNIFLILVYFAIGVFIS